MERINTCYSPYIVNNLYATNIRNLINKNGYNTLPIKEVFKSPRKFFSCKIFNFNWFEKANDARQYYFKAILLSFLHMSGKKIIYTLHNKEPHNSRDTYWSRKLMVKLCKTSDKIVGLCPDTKEVVAGLYPNAVSKLVIIPHPNYIANYENESKANLRDYFGFAKEDMVFLFMGFVSPYKNLELLIDIFNEMDNPRIKMLIAGKPCSREYEGQLENRINGNVNIKTDFRYIPDDEMVRYYNTSDIVVLPYHKTSSLNSGAAYLTFSLGKTVVCPDIGTINALKDKSFVYTYHYEDEAEHATELRKTIEKVCKDFMSDPESVHKKGLRAYQYVKQEHSDEIIGEAYDQLYGQVIK